jgi:hypothetical protein
MQHIMFTRGQAERLLAHDRSVVWGAEQRDRLRQFVEDSRGMFEEVDAQIEHCIHRVCEELGAERRQARYHVHKLLRVLTTAEREAAHEYYIPSKDQ